MVLNLSVSYNEHELITWVLREAKLAVCVPMERLLVCIWVRRWVGISGQGRNGHRAMDRVCEILALV